MPHVYPNHGVQATAVPLRSTAAPDAQRSAAEVFAMKKPGIRFFPEVLGFIELDI
jgi:hypothetical protein